MTTRQWLKPSECARRMGHHDTKCVIRAIQRGELDARRREHESGRVRYLVHISAFEEWFATVWRPTT